MKITLKGNAGKGLMEGKGDLVQKEQLNSQPHLRKQLWSGSDSRGQKGKEGLNTANSTTK